MLNETFSVIFKHRELYEIILFRSSTTTVSTTTITASSLSITTTTTKMSESEATSKDSIQIEENDDQRIWKQIHQSPFINCFKHLKKRATRSSTSSLLNDDTEGDNAISIQQHLIGVKISLEKVATTTVFNLDFFKTILHCLKITKNAVAKMRLLAFFFLTPLDIY